jgi:hypothetical protein
VRSEVKEYHIQGRSESAAFLAWFLFKFFRVDTEQASDAVCYSQNDKGIDGILVDDQTAEILLFQAKFADDGDRTQGDNDLRNFAGAAKWLRTPETVEALVQSTASAELKSLVIRSEVSKRLAEGYMVRLVFITSLPFDTNAAEYITMHADSESPLSGYDSEAINAGYVRLSMPEKIVAQHDFDLPEGGHFLQEISAATQVLVVPLKATQVADLKGIADRSLFTRNVRFGLGKTRVNRDIRSTILQREEHKNFVLYHNGITLLCDDFKVQDGTLHVENYSIVNGCQSLISFYDNRTKLSNDLLVLSKIVKVGTRRSRMADDMT